MEEIILKELITSNDYFTKVFPHIKESHFEKIEYSEIVKHIRSFYTKYEKKSNPKELALFIKNSSKLSERIKKDVLLTLKDVLTIESVESEEFLVEETEKFIQKRELTDAIFKSADIIEKNEPFEPIIGYIENALKITFDYDIGHKYESKDSIEVRYEYYTQTVEGLSIGLPSVDEALGSGLRRKTLTTVVAPSHGGKSALLISAACSAYLQKKNVLFISLEMTDLEISRRIDANLLHHPANALGGLKREEYKRRLEEVTEIGGHLVVKDYPAGVFSVLTMKALLGELKTTEGFEPDLIVIDYIGLMNSTRTTIGKAGGYAFYKSIAEELHGFAKKEDLPLLTAAQLNRSAYNNLDSGLDAIADSLGVIQTSDNVLAILSNDQLREENQALIKILKNRNTGELSSHLVQTNFSMSKFSDMGENDHLKDSVEKINVSVLQAVAEKKVDTSVMDFG